MSRRTCRVWLSWNREPLVCLSMGPLLGLPSDMWTFSPTRVYRCGVSSRGACERLGTEARVMRSVCCCLTRDLFHFLLRWWFSSRGGALALLRRLGYVGVASCCVSPLYSTMFFRADASLLLFVFFLRIVVVVPWRLRWSVSCGAAMQRLCTVLQNAPSTTTPGAKTLRAKNETI
jgi:hypothetical protein